MWIIALVACSTTPKTTAEPTVAATSFAQVLEKADAHDGTTDHTVHECTMCGLMMDGSEAHASNHEGYALHFCSDTCQKNFDADPAKALTVLGKSLE